MSKKRIAKITITLFIVLLALTFISENISYQLLAVVEVVNPTSRNMLYEYYPNNARVVSYGSTQVFVEDNLYVTEILVEINSEVTKGSVLFRAKSESSPNTTITVRAPSSGIVTEISIDEEQYVLSGEKTFVISVESIAKNGVEFYMSSEDYSMFSPITKFDISITLDEKQELRILNVTTVNETESGDMRIFAEFDENWPDDFELNEITIKKSEGYYDFTLLKDCLLSRDGRYYFLIVKERDGRIGKEYYVEEVFCTIVFDGGNYVAVKPNSEIGKDVMVVSETSKTILNNDVVRLESAYE